MLDIRRYHENSFRDLTKCSETLSRSQLLWMYIDELREKHKSTAIVLQLCVFEHWRYHSLTLNFDI